jgi:hypothetical protein
MGDVSIFCITTHFLVNIIFFVEMSSLGGNDGEVYYSLSYLSRIIINELEIIL